MLGGTFTTTLCRRERAFAGLALKCIRIGRLSAPGVWTCPQCGHVQVSIGGSVLLRVLIVVDILAYDPTDPMLPLPWKTVAAPNPQQEYVALLSLLPLKQYRTIPLFLWLTFKTQQQLRRAEGLIGYSLQAEPFSRKFWTLSAWEDHKSLMTFVRQVPHGKIMQVLALHMGKTQFVQWKASGSDIPLNWDAAKERMAVSRRR